MSSLEDVPVYIVWSIHCSQKPVFPVRIISGLDVLLKLCGAERAEAAKPSEVGSRHLPEVHFTLHFSSPLCLHRGSIFAHSSMQCRLFCEDVVVPKSMTSLVRALRRRCFDSISASLLPCQVMSCQTSFGRYSCWPPRLVKDDVTVAFTQHGMCAVMKEHSGCGDTYNSERIEEKENKMSHVITSRNSNGRLSDQSHTAERERLRAIMSADAQVMHMNRD